ADPGGRYGERDRGRGRGDVLLSAASQSRAHDASSLLLRGGQVVSPAGVVEADVLIEGERIADVGRIDPARARGAQVLEANGRLVMPGFVDAHSHAEGAVFAPQVQLALLRQGVTTVIGGQDGVSYAPGDGTYASEYFAAINGPHPTFRGGS